MVHFGEVDLDLALTLQYLREGKNNFNPGQGLTAVFEGRDDDKDDLEPGQKMQGSIKKQRNIRVRFLGVDDRGRSKLGLVQEES
jgi:hypothetical protein